MQKGCPQISHLIEHVTDDAITSFDAILSFILLFGHNLRQSIVTISSLTF